jgi:hypothetical protein
MNVVFGTVFSEVNKMLDWGTQWQIYVRILWFWSIGQPFIRREGQRRTTFILNRTEEYYIPNCKDVLYGTADTRSRGGSTLWHKQLRAQFIKHSFPVTKFLLIHTICFRFYRCFCSCFNFFLQKQPVKFTLGTEHTPLCCGSIEKY